MQDTSYSVDTRIKKGFTLIEIIIAIAIVSGLAMMGFGAFRYFNKAKVTTTETNLSNLKSILEQYRFKFNKYPDSLQELISKGYADEGDLEDGWQQQFIYELKGVKEKPPYLLYSEGDPQDENAKTIGL